MATPIELEIFVHDDWHSIGFVDVEAKTLHRGYLAPSVLEYDFAYLEKFGERLLSNKFHSLSLRYPLNYGTYRENTWPPFLLDLLPTGAAREHWLRRLKLRDGFEADFSLLKFGGINPPGHIRVKSAEPLFISRDDQIGFGFSEILERGPDFVEYSERIGAIVSGTSGAQGVAPKFLLVEDLNSKWHGDGAIPDNQIKANWLVKFPRSKQPRDCLILQTEAQYYAIAKDLGVKVHGPLKWENDALFIPRFDRQLNDKQGITRLGIESFTSAMGFADFGVNTNIEACLDTILQFSTSIEADIFEFIFRDFLNIVMGNTDNHGRNSAFLKFPDGRVLLSPLYDFAPMVLDTSGIPRAIKWSHESKYIPKFYLIVDWLLDHGFEKEKIKSSFQDFHLRLENLMSLMGTHKVENEVCDIACRRYDLFMKYLSEFLVRYEKAD
jgi:serine/threonine-protein kinase HipA